MSVDAQPLLTILIPVHNRLGCLTETLNHLRRWLDSRVEVLIVDDCSSDGTADAIEALFPEMRVLRRPLRQGPAVARNAGLEAARGRYFLPLDSDCFIVPENLHWLLELLGGSEEDLHLLLPCRSWPRCQRAAAQARERDYTAKDILLKSYGEVVPVLALSTLRRLSLRYPSLFAGGEPLLLVEVSRHQPLRFVNRLILEYRTDVPMRISSVEYQLTYAGEIAAVFEAYLPYLEGSDDPELQTELGRVLEKCGIYLALAGRRGEGLSRLRQSRATGHKRAALFQLALGLLPTSVLRGLFRLARRLQAWRKEHLR